MINLNRIGGVLAVFLIAACSQPENPEETAQSEKMTPAQLKEVVEGKAPFFFLDVRSAEEIASLGTLKGYVNIPIDDLEARLDEIPKDVPIITA